jgi:hypothetical protein
VAKAHSFVNLSANEYGSRESFPLWGGWESHILKSIPVIRFKVPEAAILTLKMLTGSRL